MLTYSVVAFMVLAILAIGAFYGAVVFGIGLQPFAWVFVGAEILLLGLILKYVLDEEKLEAQHHQAQ